MGALLRSCRPVLETEAAGPRPSGVRQATFHPPSGWVNLLVMHSLLLIDQIMRQTTVLIAQISTTAGIRAPLAHLADDVFLHLTREIERQGVSRKVVADMFGMALRGYQRKVQRLTESEASRGRTLWEAIIEHLEKHERSSRAELMKRFSPDGEERVAAVLRDLKDSGMIFSLGRGDATLYGLSSTQDRARMFEKGDTQALPNVIWFSVYRSSKTISELAEETGVERERVRECVEQLVADGAIAADGPDLDSAQLSSERFLVPVGSEHGWEVAVFDHYRAVATAIASKLAKRDLRSRTNDRIGGMTLVFDVSEQHPYAERVYGLLESVRSQVNTLWQEVSEYNKSNRPEGDLVRVTFYAGQNVEDENGEEK